MRTSKVIEKILREDPVARDSDRRLILAVWEHYGLVLTREQRAKFMDTPSTESIRRTRQKFQEHGMYLASERINEARYKKFKNVRANINSAEPDEVLDSVPAHPGKQTKMFGEDNRGIR